MFFFWDWTFFGGFVVFHWWTTGGPGGTAGAQLLRLGSASDDPRLGYFGTHLHGRWEGWVGWLVGWLVGWVVGLGGRQGWFRFLVRVGWLVRVGLVGCPGRWGNSCLQKKCHFFPLQHDGWKNECNKVITPKKWPKINGVAGVKFT